MTYEEDPVTYDGMALCLIKRVHDDTPFCATWVPATQVSATRWKFQRPSGPAYYKGGGGGVHYKLVPETFIKTTEED